MSWQCQQVLNRHHGYVFDCLCPGWCVGVILEFSMRAEGMFFSLEVLLVLIQFEIP